MGARRLRRDERAAAAPRRAIRRSFVCPSRNTFSLAHTLNAQVAVDTRAQCCAATGDGRGAQQCSVYESGKQPPRAGRARCVCDCRVESYALCCSLLLTCGGLPDACVAVRLVPARLLLVSRRAAHGGVRLRAGGDGRDAVAVSYCCCQRVPVQKQIAVRDATCCARNGATTLTGLDVAAMTTGRNPARIIPPASFGPPSVLLRQPTRLPSSPLSKQLSTPTHFHALSPLLFLSPHLPSRPCQAHLRWRRWCSISHSTGRPTGSTSRSARTHFLEKNSRPSSQHAAAHRHRKAALSAQQEGTGRAASWR